MNGKEEDINSLIGSKNSINEHLWRGEIKVQELIELLSKVPPDAFVRIYANKLQMVSPIDERTYTLDCVR